MATSCPPPASFKRFLREADFARTIEHDNVVRTYNCDALLHGGVQQSFLVMEYVEDQTLRDLKRELERFPDKGQTRDFQFRNVQTSRSEVIEASNLRPSIQRSGATLPRGTTAIGEQTPTRAFVGRER